MTIPKDYENRSLYHFTHIDNLESILKHGLLSKNEKIKMGLIHRDISYEEIQERRFSTKVTCGNCGCVHDYVPFYFCRRSPMLFAVVNNKIADQKFIIYLEFPIQIMDQYEMVFTNRSVNTDVPPNFYNDSSNLGILNWEAIDTWKWNHKYDIAEQTPIRQQKQCEVLFHKKLPLSSLKKVVVFSEEAKKTVCSLFVSNGNDRPLVTIERNDYYYTGESIPKYGPHEIKFYFDSTWNDIYKNRGGRKKYRFDSIAELLFTLNKNVGCLPETAEIIELKTDNNTHREDVGDHTLKVVSKLREINEFNKLSLGDRYLVEVAAYLHDIGKGPKKRWRFNDGVQKVDPDHPVNGLLMLKRILTEEVAPLPKRSVGLICKLVCYHDLVGDIVAKGRREEELKEIVCDENELNMLIAISKADMKSIEPSWLTKNETKIEILRRNILRSLKPDLKGD